MSIADIPIIVTRAAPGAQETVERLQKHGMKAVSASMLSLHELSETAVPPAASLSGLVFTSANGVRSYAARVAHRTLTAWCVGPATAEAARVSGFTDVRESAGNAMDLAQFIAAHSAPEDRPLLHVANAAAAGQLQQNLQGRGFRITFAPLYEMRPAEGLPDEVSSLIRARAPSVLLIHSAKGAAALAALSETLPDSWRLAAISAQAAAPLAAHFVARTFLAEAPNEDGLMAALDTAIATLSA
ncbi:MAG: uroporphyrinogen-III synthase [Pseudomonadota bacterium]